MFRFSVQDRQHLSLCNCPIIFVLVFTVDDPSNLTCAFDHVPVCDSIYSNKILLKRLADHVGMIPLLYGPFRWITGIANCGLLGIHDSHKHFIGNPRSSDSGCFASSEILKNPIF